MFVSFEEVAAVEYAKHVVRAWAERAAPTDALGLVPPLADGFVTFADEVMDTVTALETSSWPEEQQTMFWGGLRRPAVEEADDDGAE